MSEHFIFSILIFLVTDSSCFFIHCSAFNKIHADDVTEVDDDLMPHDADFFIGYATIPGYVSYRHEDDGSWYISTLVEHLNKYAKK